MSAESKALVRRYVEEVLNKKNLALVDELFASSFIDHDSSMPEARGPAGVKRLAAMAHASFPDLHFTVEDMVAEGNKVVYRYSLRGTHRNDFMGIAATGKQVNVTGIHIYRVGEWPHLAASINLVFASRAVANKGRNCYPRVHGGPNMQRYMPGRAGRRAYGPGQRAESV